MKLIKDWKYICRRAWSVRLSLLSSVLSAIELAMTHIATGETPWFVFGAFLVSVSAAVSRIVVQESIYDDYANAP